MVQKSSMSKIKWMVLIVGGLVLLVFGFILILFIANNAAIKQATQPIAPFPSDFSELRIENEGKLVVPDMIVEDTWDYMLNRLVEDKSFIKSIDPNLDSYWYDELFTDVYFDTSQLVMLNHQSGIRYRTRINLTDPEAEKSGRELMQIKINDIGDNNLSRGELKFDIRDDGVIDDTDDLHPVIGLVKDSDRRDFLESLRKLGIDPYELRKILVLEQRRRSIYVTNNGEALMSIRFDNVTSNLWFATFSHCEIEVEINEIAYTEGDKETRLYMENVQKTIMDDVISQYPDIYMDLTPKYNKAFNYFESEIPFFRGLISLGIIF